MFLIYNYSIIYIHVMVEELLQLLIAEVDADLLKCIEFKDLQMEKVFDPPMALCK